MNSKLMNKKFSFLVILSLLLKYELISYNSTIYKKKIFTFWEPKDKIPGYIRLCIKTWEKYLTDYEIIILDYEIAKKYLGEYLFTNIICKNMSTPMQTDGLRVALLKKFGGIWLDADTIILKNTFIKQLENYELAMIGDNKSKFQYIGFIYGSKKSSLLNIWLNQIIKKVKFYKYIVSNKKNNTKWLNSWKKAKSLFYLGYDIINSLLKNVTDNKYYRLDATKMNVFPERKFYKNPYLRYRKLFELFYFQKGDPQILLNSSIDIIMLHNSWVPVKYKQMSENEFIRQDILLSKLLSELIK